jgi:hypothetical protein
VTLHWRQLMRGEVRYAAWTVIAHAAVVALHAPAHVKLQILMSWLAQAFIVMVIILAPPVSLALLWVGRYSSGFMLLAGSMLGSLLFGAYNHFAAPGLDNFSGQPASARGELFKLTSILLLVIEGLGCLVGVRGLGKLRTGHAPD